MGMATFKFMPLCDASYFLNQGRGVPQTQLSYEQVGRNLRSSILMSWAAVEGAASYELEKLKKSGYKGKLPESLRGRLKLLLEQKQQSFDLESFKEWYKWRNRITHPQDSRKYTQPSFDIAQGNFNYCLGLMRGFYSLNLDFS
jgi:hypothetical protein